MKRWLRTPQRILQSRRTRQAALLAVAILVLVNGFCWLWYRSRTYPNTTISGNNIGNRSISEVSKDLSKISLLPVTVTLQYKDKTTKLSPSELGMRVDEAETTKMLKTKRSWLPVWNLFSGHKIDTYIRVDEKVYKTAQDKLAQTYRQDATNARISLKDGEFSIEPEAAGYKLDEQATGNTIVLALRRGQNVVQLPTTTLTAQITKDKLTANLVAIQKQQTISITFRYQAKSKKLTSKDISTWYVVADSAYVLSDAQIKTSITAIARSFGVIPQNTNEAVAASKRALQQSEALDFTFVPMPASKTFTYCVRLRGVDASYQAGLESKLKAVYADERGWNLGGRVSYVQVDSGCSFTVWLTAADQMPTFGSICDSQWSCEVSPNVVINFDRWRFASTAWNNGGGSLEDYRAMVINHETGHWLGFGHRNCPGAGQAAPVMQQQSIDLQGCTFNPWPTSGELDTLKSWLNI